MDTMWGETTVSLDALKAGRGKLFDEGNFGMFIHWGVYAEAAGQWEGKNYYGIGEWIMYRAKIKTAETDRIMCQRKASRCPQKVISDSS